MEGEDEKLEIPMDKIDGEIDVEHCMPKILCIKKNFVNHSAYIWK